MSVESTTEAVTSTADQVLIKAMEAATATGNFVVEQAPDLVQQLLSYSLFESLVYLAVYTTLTVCAVLSARHSWRDFQKCTMRDPFTVFVASVVVGLMSIAPAIVEILQIAKIVLAPKIFLIEYTAQLIK